MLNIILFYIVALSYFIYLYFYIKIKFINNDSSNFNDDVKRFNRNVLLVSVFTVLISFELLFSIPRENAISQKGIGIALAIGTFIFYTIFLIWDIFKDKIATTYISEEYNLESTRFLNISSNVVISSISILILEIVLSIIIMMGGL